MLNLIDYPIYFVQITLLFNFVSSLVIGFKLYKSAPERSSMGFNKYWNTFMMEAWPGRDKNLLIYDDQKYRLKLFELYKFITVSCWIIMGFCILAIFILR
jgi:hypothetical protein